MKANKKESPKRTAARIATGAGDSPASQELEMFLRTKWFHDRELARLLLLGPTRRRRRQMREAVKQMAPNGWNATWYEGDQFHKGDNMFGVGVSGALPWGKQ